MKFPDLEFRTIVVDPPWTPEITKYNGKATKASPQHHYSTMSLDDICDLKPPIAKQCHLYIWCLSQHVDWGYKVAEAWGGKPVILWTWKKPGLGVGRFRCNTEHILVTRVGPRAGNAFGYGKPYEQATPGTCFEWPRGKHSEKPSEFYKLVESISPEPRLDMYARIKREGWYCWGDEVE